MATVTVSLKRRKNTDMGMVTELKRKRSMAMDIPMVKRRTNTAMVMEAKNHRSKIKRLQI